MSLSVQIKHKINTKTKPIGALGRLEEIALQIALLQKTESPSLLAPHILVFAADHGIAREGLSAYPQEVTWQMVLNFVQAGAAINVLARQHGIALKVIDAGVNKDLSEVKGIIHAKIGWGTQNFAQKPALTLEELKMCKQKAQEIVQTTITDTYCNIMGFGEMGIANTSAASMLMHCLTQIPLTDCVGKGTGLNDEQLQHKYDTLQKAVEFHQIDTKNIEEVMCTFGGFEIAMIAEAMLAAFEHRCIVLVDGFIASAAYLYAFKINPCIAENAIFCHQSEEKGHQLLLEYLGAKPLLDLCMRLGEGTGCAVAYPIVESAVRFLNEMASFESAGVSDKEA